MRILSGIQPSGKLHVGNYFGMMRPALHLQEKGDAYLFIADYHALTSVSDAAALRQGTRDVALDFLACGLDPTTPATDLAGLVAAARADFAAVPVGTRVNDVRNDDAGLLERVAAAGTGDLFGGAGSQ